MQAIEFETTVQNHVIHIPNSIPNGASIRVLVLMNDEGIRQSENSDVNTLLASVTEEKPFFEQLRLGNECADDDLALLFERDKDTGRDIAL